MVESLEGIDAIDLGEVDDTITVGANEIGSGAVEGGLGFDNLKAVSSFSFLNLDDALAEITAHFNLGPVPTPEPNLLITIAAAA